MSQPLRRPLISEAYIEVSDHDYFVIGFQGARKIAVLRDRSLPQAKMTQEGHPNAERMMRDAQVSGRIAEGLLDSSTDNMQDHSRSMERKRDRHRSSG
jgi:hypothetical protein